MRWSPTPDLTSPRGLVLATLAASAAVWAILVLLHPDITTRLGDTDDAMRLFLVRDLLHGRAWYDQRVTRLAPPSGVYMHWSRLLDGAIGAMDWLLGRAMPPDRAEWATRFFWPLLWIPVATGGALVIARRFGTRAAVFLAVPLFITLTPMLYRQFTPGRIDHHNVQISMAMLALAAAIRAETSRPAPHKLWPAALAGGAGGLGLAVGLEALPFHALIGLSFGLRLAVDRNQARICAAYGVALGLSSLGFYVLQTPPQRWDLSFCDAIGLNLVMALVIAGAGLFLVASLSRRLPAPLRIGLLGVVGLAAGAAYLAADPACIAGPFAGVDPRIRPLWLDRVQEIQPLSRLLTAAPGLAVEALTALVMVTAAAAFLVWRAFADARRPRFLEAVPVVTLAAAVVMADVAGSEAWRMFDYIYWIGAPTLAAALSYLAAHVAKDRLVPTVALSVCLSPLFVGGAAGAAAQALSPSSTDQGFPLCNEVRGFAPLAALAPGVVLSEVNLGPHMIANTPHTAVAAPYHRMAASIIAAHDAFAAPPAGAEARVRALGATYVVDCPGSYMGVPAGSFGWRLRRGQVPAWLEPVPAAGTKLVIYRVRPAGPAAASGDPR
jgi:hypothetical protein